MNRSTYTTARMWRQTLQKVKAAAALADLSREEILDQALSAYLDGLIYSGGGSSMAEQGSQVPAKPLSVSRNGPIA
jgi:hypothetical protein